MVTKISDVTFSLLLITLAQCTDENWWQLFFVGYH